MTPSAVGEKVSRALYPKSTWDTPLLRTARKPIPVMPSSGSQRNLMNHYAIDQWADFSRGLTLGEEAAQMRAHLAEGCTECGRLSDVMRKLAHVCETSAAVQVPESTLRLARAIFPVRISSRPKRGNRIPIELIFDSFLA